MIESIIASSHHYYVVFVESTQVKTLASLMKIFDSDPTFEYIKMDAPKQELPIHLQLEIDECYGSESLLQINKSRTRKGTTTYWYDFYIGKVPNQKNPIFYICYPYSRVARFLESSFDSNNISRHFYKPKVNKVLEFMKSRGTKDLLGLEKQGFELDITKYTAEIKDEANANKVNLIGDNPLDSRIFQLLENDKSITIEATALKLKCKNINIGELEMSFDRLGNYRFWLKRDLQKKSVPIISFLFQFFAEIDSLEQSRFISTRTLLEDE